MELIVCLGWLVGLEADVRYGLNLRAGNIYGWVGLGDEVIWVQKLEGVGNASTLTSKEFPVFIGDIRLAKISWRRSKLELAVYVGSTLGGWRGTTWMPKQKL